MPVSVISIFFFFNDTATTEIYTLSLHDALPIWLNGKKVLSADPLPPWGQMPWLHYMQKNITGEVKSGKNLLGIAVTRYAPRNQRAQPGNGQTPMSATLYIEMTDGSVEVFATGGKGWKSALNATGEWF